MCRHFHVVASESVLDDVVNDCDLDRDGFINFLEFANFLNLKDKMPLDRREQHLVMNSEYHECRNCQWKTSFFIFWRIYLGYDHKLRLSELPGRGALLTTNDLEPFKTGNSKRIVRTLRRPEALSDRFITTASFIGAAVEEPQPSCKLPWQLLWIQPVATIVESPLSKADHSVV